MLLNPGLIDTLLCHIIIEVVAEFINGCSIKAKVSKWTVQAVM